MKFIRLTQSTPEWLEWRRGGITASDVSALFGKNPYKTEWKLWAEKTGLQAEDDVMGNPYVRRGKDFEHLLREHVVEERQIGIFPACVEHDTLSFLRASLDGIDRHRKPWEFKIPSPGNFEEVRKHRLNSEPAQRYFYQVQQQLLVTGSHEGFLVFGRLEESDVGMRVVETILLIVTADAAVQQEIVARSQEFLRKVRDGIEPAKDPDRDVFAPQTQEDAHRWATASQAILPLLSRKAELKAMLDEVEAAIKSAADPVIDVLGQNKFGEFAGLRAMRVDRKGSVDWAELVKAHGLDPTDETTVGPYRKAGTKSHQFTAL